MTPLRAVFLDVGDTVLRANPSWEGVYTLALEEYGVSVESEALRDALRSTYHHGRYGLEDGFEATPETSFRRTVEMDQRALDDLGVGPMPEEFFRRLSELFMLVSSWHVFPDVMPALDALHSRGLVLGAVSNWIWQLPELLHSLELVSHFDFVAASARVGYEKPHRGIFEHALREAGVAAEEAIHVGDHLDADVQGAAAIGIAPVLIDRRERFAESDLPEGVPLIRSLAELIPLVDARLQRAERVTDATPAHPWRCFVAVPLPDDLRATLRAWLDDVRRDPSVDAHWRWADPDAWHITLAFLGATPPHAVPGIRERLAQDLAGTTDFVVAAGGLGAFPGATRARVLWYGIQDVDGRLADLARSVRAATEIEEEAAFRPHVTLARARDRRGPPVPALPVATVPAGHVAVTGVSLMRSHLGGGPARYETLGEISLCRRRRRSPGMSKPIALIRPPHVAVIGEGDPRGAEASRLLEWAEEVGSLLARSGATVVTGGLGGVMRAASRGAASAGGMTLGILPGADAREANDYVRQAIPTGLGVVRNLVVVTAADSVLAVGGRHGTLSEIGLALRMGRHVVTLSSWRLEAEHRYPGPRVHRGARDPRDAVALALRLAEAGPEPPA